MCVNCVQLNEQNSWTRANASVVKTVIQDTGKGQALKVTYQYKLREQNDHGNSNTEWSADTLLSMKHQQYQTRKCFNAQKRVRQKQEPLRILQSFVSHRISNRRRRSWQAHHVFCSTRWCMYRRFHSLRVVSLQSAETIIKP